MRKVNGMVKLHFVTYDNNTFIFSNLLSIFAFLSGFETEHIDNCTKKESRTVASAAIKVCSNPCYVFYAL